jgi:hypothetical protein
VNVTLSGTSLGLNHANENGDVGVSIITDTGNILVKYFDSSENVLDGLHLSTGGTSTVTVNNSQANGNYATGFSISSANAVSMDQVTVNNNQSEGILINVALGAAKPVQITRANLYGNYQENLWISTDGLVTLNGIHADHSLFSYGVKVDNSVGTAGVNLLNTLGSNTFNYNFGDGILILSKGPITVNGATAIHNGKVGMELNNKANTLGTATVSVTGGLFTYNTGCNDTCAEYAGLFIFSNGVVSITKIQSFHNGTTTSGYGVYINSNNHNVTITNSAIIGNQNAGIYAAVGPAGTLTLSNTFYFGNQLGSIGSTVNLIVTH